MSPAFFCSYLGKHLRLWQSAGIIPLQSPLPASHVEGLQFNGYRDWKFVHLLLALAPSSHLSVFLVARKGDTDRRQSRFRGDFRHLPGGRACATHCIVVLITSTIITPSAHGFSQCSQAGFCGFLTFFFVVIFLFNHGPKGRRQYFIYSVTQLVRGKDVCVRHVNINQNLRSSFSTDILSTAPKEV